ncbi:helix-turn-helix domain-containing protein [Streptomyces sp. DSM 44915]|uniref:Helix-turn-helix domain-containing protein n=1 Tax=Streptomyces chisholmiae TaxID=3075540 RepID=A0ABU2JNK3_9ACTN|nr:helix-turn-helix domain-containing protein [Streptomyces sp. DSM 44915]MDT0266575.1 helix-turn-helix domain-containing protein [Streptomyces sp. DSM 44915]
MPDPAYRPAAPGDGRRCPRCGHRVSRYNDARHCSPCAQALRREADSCPRVHESTWAEPEVQSAIAARDFGALCRLVRGHAQLRQEDLAELSGLSQAFLSMLEQGNRRLTNIDKIIDLVNGLGVPAQLAARMFGRPG